MRFMGPLALALLLGAPAAEAARPAKATRTGTVLVRSTTTGALVIIDGHEVGEVPMRLPLALRAGSHTVKVTRPGYADYLDTFRIKPGQDLVLEIDLLPTAAVLRVGSSVDGAIVAIDGRQIGTAPFEGEVEPGPHVLEVRASGYTSLRQEVTLAAGEVHLVDATLVPVAAVEVPDEGPTPWYGRWYVWAGAVAVVAGGVTAAVLLSQEDDGPPEPDFTLRIRPVP